MEHILLGCNRSNKVWFYDRNLDKPANLSAWFRGRFHEIFTHPNGGDDNLANLCWLVWSIWIGRFKCIFEHRALIQFSLQTYN